MQIKDEGLSKEKCRAEAKRWLDKRIEHEEAGKSAKMVDLCLEKAVAYENASLDGRK